MKIRLLLALCALLLFSPAWAGKPSEGIGAAPGGACLYRGRWLPCQAGAGAVSLLQCWKTLEAIAEKHPSLILQEK